MAEENIDDEIKRLEAELKAMDSDSSSYGSPPMQDKDNLFKFFRHILDTQDTTRIGKLDKNELGSYKLGVRDWKELGDYSETEGLELVAKYCRAKAEIMTSTSMSKEGFWPQLFVSQIKRETKITQGEKPQSKKWWGFSKKQEGSEL